MERGLIGTVSIAIISSLVVAAFMLPRGDNENISLLNVEYPDVLVAASSDSVGENAFSIAFICPRPQISTVVEFSFLYGHTDQGHEEVSRAIHAMSGMVPVEHTRTYSGTTDFNGSEVRYSVHDFRGFNQIFNDTNQCVFMLLTKGDDIVASFSGVPDLFPKRELGSLIDATVTRSGNRTYYSRRSLEEAGSVQIDYLPSGCLVFEEVESDETIEISYRSDAFFTSLNKGGAVQVISIFCDGEPEVLLLNFVV